MTACVLESITDSGAVRLRPAPMAIAADGGYAARLVSGVQPGSWYPERWTLGGPEPYAVPLPLDQPEEVESELLPLADGRVLIRRRVADRHDMALLYPSGPSTGELPLGSVMCDQLTLLPPPPGGADVYALAPGERSTAVWRVHGGPAGPERVAELPGRCSGGAWLDRAGRLLALDQELAEGGPVKAVAVDLARGGETSPLLQITEDSNDRVLLADPDSGLLLVRSDAAGHDRLGWGVLGSRHPLRFPEVLRLADAAVTPFAVQPGQVLMPENCAVALRIDGPAGSRVGIWRPAGRRLHQLPAPMGWLAGVGLWTVRGELRLPCSTPQMPCGVARTMAPADGAGPARAALTAGPAGEADLAGRAPSEPEPRAAAALRPVPLQQAPMARTR
ncbi:hypothetical protein [Streptomyces sp. NPDC048639]|uniref:hypothetical protein n=1 Tax=Streptomyces sp. NPDC048639 TaxID=3365581 RepID=UPI003721EFE8